MSRNAWEWDEQDLLSLINLGVQEGLELDYKQCDSLQRSDGKKNELSKDVSAFANSAGGVIVYGMREDGHVPIALDSGFDPAEISKEWIEQVINSRIQRRIDGIRINQVTLSTTQPGKVAYVVVIPSSPRAPHQAADKRFYKRFNFESVPMEEYEIRDVSNRATTPELDIDFKFQPGGDKTVLVNHNNKAHFLPVDFSAVIFNQAQAIAECAVVHLYLDQRLKLASPSSDVTQNNETESLNVDGNQITLRKLTVLWDRSKGLPIFSGISANLPNSPLCISIPKTPSLFILRYIIGAPGMAPKDRWVFLTVKDNVATFTRPESQAGTATEPP